MATNIDEKEKIWTNSFVLNFIVNFLVNLNMYLLIVIIAGYTQQQFNASESTARLVAGLFIVGSLFGRFIMGKYVNSLGPKTVLIIGATLFTITSAFYFVETSVGFLILVRILNGFSFGVCTTSTGSIADYITPQSRKGEGISLFSLSMVLGAAVGPFLGLLLLQDFSIEVIFGLNLILSAISLIIALIMKVPFETVKLSKEEKGFHISQFVTKEAIPIAIVVFVSGLTYSSILNFMNPFAAQRDLVTASSYFFIVYAIISIISRPICGRLMDNKNENYVIYPSIIFYIICFVVLANSQSSWMLLLSGAILGLGYGNLTSTSQSVSVKVVPKEKIARATSTFFIGLDLGLGFGPYLLGSFVHKVGISNMYLIMAAVLVVTFFIYYLIHGKNVRTA